MQGSCDCQLVIWLYRYGLNIRTCVDCWQFWLRIFGCWLACMPYRLSSELGTVDTQNLSVWNSTVLHMDSKANHQKIPCDMWLGRSETSIWMQSGCLKARCLHRYCPTIAHETRPFFLDKVVHSRHLFNVRPTLCKSVLTSITWLKHASSSCIRISDTDDCDEIATMWMVIKVKMMPLILRPQIIGCLWYLWMDFSRAHV